MRIDEAVAQRGARFRREGVGRRLQRIGNVFAGVRADHLAGAVTELERHRAGGRVLEVEIDGRAAGRVLALREAPPAAAKPPHRCGRLEEKGCPRGDGVGELPQQRHVVDHPEGSPMSGGDQIVAVHRQVAHTRSGQVELQGLPPAAVVERDIDSGLGAGIQQSAPDRVLANRARVRARGNAVGDGRPGLAVVRRPPQVRLEVVLLVSVRCHIGGARVVVRELDTSRPRELPVRLGRYVLPVRAGVARDVNQPVVAPRPEQALHERRLGERINRPVPLRARHVVVDRAARARERGGIVHGEVGRNLLPARALRGGAVDELRRDIERSGIVRRNQNRKGPLEPKGYLGRRHAVVVAEPDGNVTHLPRTMVNAREDARVAAAISNRRIARIHGDGRILAPRHRVVVAHADGAVVRAARDRDGAVVLLRAVDAIGKLIVGRDVIELRGGLVLHARPRGTGIERNRGASIIGIDHPPRVPRVNPELVRVTVGHAHHRKRLPSVGRTPHLQVHHVHRVLVERIGRDRRVVEGADGEFRITTRELPRPAAVVGAEDAASGIGRLDAREHALRIRR